MLRSPVIASVNSSARPRLLARSRVAPITAHVFRQYYPRRIYIRIITLVLTACSGFQRDRATNSRSINCNRWRGMGAQILRQRLSFALEATVRA